MEDGTETMLAIQSDDNPAADTFAFRSGGCAASGRCGGGLLDRLRDQSGSGSCRDLLRRPSGGKEKPPTFTAGGQVAWTGTVSGPVVAYLAAPFDLRQCSLDVAQQDQPSRCAMTEAARLRRDSRR
jgi:hypothetical protein